MNTSDLAVRFSSQQKAATIPAALPTVNAGKTVAAGADESEAEVCFICASPVVHEAIMPCNHRTCHICCLRMRALYKDKNCMHCRVSGYSPLPISTCTNTFRLQPLLLFSRTTLRKDMRISQMKILRAVMITLAFDMRMIASGTIR
jgi:hypothetical protein